MQTRVIPPAEGAYQYPLLIKRLLMSGRRYEKTREIVYRDQLRYSYLTLGERIARLANVLTEAGVRADASRRISVRGSLSAAKFPASTTGTLAISMPRVVPMITISRCGYCAASITVATCVLSPISAMKNAISVVMNGP